MRTKTLLMSAAALAAGVISSQAQSTVYSQNVVGYVNVTMPANSFNLIGNQLDLGAGSNTLNNVLNNGLISYSGPSGTETGQHQTTIFIWNGTSFTGYFYYNSADSGGAPGWYDSGGNPVPPSVTLNPSQAAFVQNNYTSPITVTLTGQVDQGTNTWTQVTPGFNFYSEPAPLAGTPLDSTNINFPATSYTAGNGSQDTFQAWTGSGYGPAYFYYNYSDSGGAPGWYNAAGTVNEDTNAAAWPTVGQGFQLQHFGATSNWVSTFEVQ